METETHTKNVRFYGERVRALRHTRGISADRLARATELSVRHVYRLENNERPNIWGTTIARIAQALQTSCDYLMGLTDNADAVC
ncbi:MAG TPA: helix-turn-helix transcriptional regulator [Anaerolineae bacterium]|nr:helix-turn-helix transcriptional regulator [Anaerolineae bacterium]HUM35717.1 helix-turn-helix transcriptional regulator [Anaerolineae bacterium]